SAGDSLQQPTSPSSVSQQAAAGDGEDPLTVQSVLCHEHPRLLRRALEDSRKRLLIISPWVRHQVVDQKFLDSLEALLRRDVIVHIGYGLEDKEGAGKGAPGLGKIAITEKARKNLERLGRKYKTFHLIYVGNTHRKLLVS